MIEQINLLQNTASTWGIQMRGLQVAISRAFGKNHAAEQHKNLMRGMTIMQTVIDEATVSTKDFNLTFPKVKEFKPKGKRIKDHEPYYVKLTRPRRG